MFNFKQNIKDFLNGTLGVDATELEKRNRIGKLTYEEYMKSDEWAERKNLYFSTHIRICAACGSDKYIDLHHTTYSSKGFEKDDDLVALCKTCHDQYHAIYEKPSLIDTKNFIDAKQASTKGKEIFRKYKEIIVRNHNEWVKKINANWNFEGWDEMRISQRKKLVPEIEKVAAILESFPRKMLEEIIKKENPGVKDGVCFYPREISNDELRVFCSSWEYRWVKEEIISITYKSGFEFSELRKLRDVLEQKLVL